MNKTKMEKAIGIFGGDRVAAAIMVDKLPQEPALAELLKIRSMAPRHNRVWISSLKAIQKATGNFEQWEKASINATNRDSALHDIATRKAIEQAANIFELYEISGHATTSQLKMIMAKIATIRAPFSEWDTLHEGSRDPFKTLCVFRMAATAAEAADLLRAYDITPTHHTNDLRSLKWILLQAMVLDETIDINQWWEIFWGSGGDEDLKKTAWNQTQIIFKEAMKAA